jgi:mono/diheme cytochrome c family protein
MHGHRTEIPSMRACWNARISSLVLVYLMLIAAVVMAHGNQTPAAGNPEARKLKNPVAASPQSIAAGKKNYDKFCAFCHGDEGKGDGPMAPKGSHPSNLTDAEWTHGGTDGEIFTIISDGAGQGSAMKSFKSKLTPDEIWNTVNYVRSLAKPH